MVSLTCEAGLLPVHQPTNQRRFAHWPPSGRAHPSHDSTLYKHVHQQPTLLPLTNMVTRRKRKELLIKKYRREDGDIPQARLLL